MTDARRRQRHFGDPFIAEAVGDLRTNLVYRTFTRVGGDKMPRPWANGGRSWSWARP
jgi:hypothetical protein